MNNLYWAIVVLAGYFYYKNFYQMKKLKAFDFKFAVNPKFDKIIHYMEAQGRLDFQRTLKDADAILAGGTKIDLQQSMLIPPIRPNGKWQINENALLIQGRFFYSRLTGEYRVWDDVNKKWKSDTDELCALTTLIQFEDDDFQVSQNCVVKEFNSRMPAFFVGTRGLIFGLYEWPKSPQDYIDERLSRKKFLIAEIIPLWKISNLFVSIEDAFLRIFLILREFKSFPKRNVEWFEKHELKYTHSTTNKDSEFKLPLHLKLFAPRYLSGLAFHETRTKSYEFEHKFYSLSVSFTPYYTDEY